MAYLHVVTVRHLYGSYDSAALPAGLQVTVSLVARVVHVFGILQFTYWMHSQYF